MVLAVLYPPAGVDTASAPTVDIIIIHGLNGDTTESWTNPETKAFWPKDFLPYDIPEARVLTFRYNADAAFGNTTADIVDHAKDLLRLISFMHFDWISEDIFRQAWENSEEEGELGSDWTVSNRVSWLQKYASSKWGPFLIRDPAILLASFSLINIDAFNNVSMHPLVHTWGRDRLDEVEGRRWFFTAASLLATSMPRGEEISDYRFRKSLVSHVITCLKSLSTDIFFSFDGSEEERLGVARCFIKVLIENAQSQEAISLEERVLEMCKRTLGKEHPNTLVSIHHLAYIHSNLGRPQDAINLQEKMLEARKRMLGEEHPDTLISINNLANCYNNLARPQDALELQEKVLEGQKRTLGEEHPDLSGR